MKRISQVILIVVVLAGLIYAGFHFGAKLGADKAVAAMRARVVVPYVQTGKPVLKNVEKKTRFIALVKPLNAVDVKTQVSGTIQDVLFSDGQFVHEGDTLFLIEQDRYKANVSAAKATLTKAEADLKQVKSDYKRQKELHDDKVVSTADLEKAESRMLQAEAAVQQAKASLELAEIDLKHTTIQAPIDGRIGQVLITKGNYVDLTSHPLARIVQTTPVKITFSLSDKETLQMRKMINSKEQPKQKQTLQLELSDKSVLPLPADNIVVDNEMDKETATISLYAQYDNVDELLIPNNHVTILWNSAEEKAQLMIPQTALYNDANGTYVMLVEKTQEGEKAIQQYVQKGEVIDNQAIIESGLKPTDTIVLSGGQKLQNGQNIHIISTEAQ